MITPVECTQTAKVAAKRLNLLQKFGITKDDISVITGGDAKAIQTFKREVSRFNRKTKYKLKDCYVSPMIKYQDIKIKSLKDIINLVRDNKYLGVVGNFTHICDCDHNYSKISSFEESIKNFINNLNFNIKEISPQRKNENMYNQVIGVLRGKNAGKFHGTKTAG
jgi:hypothetical protein